MKIWIICLIAISKTLYAAPELKECKSDIEKFCSNDPDRIGCLLKNKTTLSTACSGELDRLSAILKSAGPRGSGGLASFSGIMGGMGLMPPKKKIINYSGALAPEDNPTQITQQKLSLTSPFWSHGKESAAVSINTGIINFGEARNFEKETFKTPKSLNRVEVGGNYSKELENSRIIGFRASLGSASDKIFYSAKEITFSLNGSYAFPAKDSNNYWITTFFMSNNNPLLNYIPIPGFIYLKKTEKFTGMFGLPFLSLQWTPTDKIILSSSFFITNYNAEAAYKFTDSLQLFTGFAISQQTFLREERRNLSHRLFFNEKKIYVGLKRPFGNVISGDVQFGQSFDRELREGRSFNDTELKANFGRSWYTSANVILMY